MEFHSGKKQFELRIEGYQFLDGDNQYDRNWLMVYCGISVPAGHWSFTDAFAFTWDIQRWADMFDNIPSQPDPSYELSLEYVIAFNYLGMKDDIFH